MKINQAFEILKSAGGVRAARIITENKDKLSRVFVWHAARNLRRGMPVAKIIRRRWFYGIHFYTTRHTLDPRPDTETLVSAVIADMGTVPNLRILDLGTGTGCIIISLVKNIAGARGVGIDASIRACRVARRNVREFTPGRIKVMWRSFNCPQKIPGAPFDVIVTNPPYIARGDARVDTGATFDPDRALYAGNFGLGAYEMIAKNAGAWLKQGGNLYTEIGDGQDIDVKTIFAAAGWEFVRAECDLSGITRVLVFKK